MAPEVIQRKIRFLTEYLSELEKYRDVSLEEFHKHHYAVERLLQLLADVSSDIVFHLFANRDEPMPLTYRSGFLRAGEIGLLSKQLSQELANAAGMRNILVHGYEQVDEHLVWQSIKVALKWYPCFIQELSKFINE